MTSHVIKRRFGPVVAVLAALAMLATLLPSTGGQAADHLDAAGFTPPGGDDQADLNDLYAFAGSESTTVLAVTAVPAAPGDATFGSDILYEIKVDTDGDAIENHSFEISFSDVRDNGGQFLRVQHAEGDAAVDGSANGTLVGYGQTGGTLPLPDGGQIWTGLRSDPFFMDLAGFQGTLAAFEPPETTFPPGADTDRTLNDGNENDFFLPLDTLAIVVEVPDEAIGLNEGTFGSELGLTGSVGVWATTSGSDGEQIDRIGRPGINTVVNAAVFDDLNPVGVEDVKDLYNQTEPKDDGAFREKAADVLMQLSSIDDEGSYSQCQAETLASVLLPDILPYSKNDVLPSPLEGRALEDDVIDTLLRVGTGGDPLSLFGPDGTFCMDGPPRDADGGINGDGIGPHDDYLASFPYLGEPHADVTVPEFGGEDFMAPLQGVNEVPPVDTEAAGVSAFSLQGSANIEHLNLAYNLEGAVAGHIHIGDPGENGPVAVFLYESGGETINGMISEGVLEQDDLVVGDIEDLIDVMQGGFAYANFHTTEHPAGEIRGQIEALTATDVFTDDDQSVHEANIDTIAAAGITIGCNPPDNTEYCPERDIIRGEMAAFMARAFNLPVGPDAFTDDSDSVFEGDINAIAAVDITRGCNPPTNDEYCPDRDMTRGEMAAFVVRAWALPASDVDAFVDDEGSVFEADINALAAAGVTVGCNPPENDEFCPERNMSRAEMASFMARAFGWEG